MYVLPTPLFAFIILNWSLDCIESGGGGHNGDQRYFVKLKQ